MKIKITSCLLLALVLFSINAAAQNTPVRKIVADVKKSAGKKITVYNECIGAGRANEGLRADWQQQLTMLQKDMNYKYIRFHGLLHDDMRVFIEDKNGVVSHNWQYIDKLFDFLLSVKIRPFVEFGFMPNDLASGVKTVFWWKSNVTKPRSYEKWDDLIAKLVAHWQERYGKEEVAKWYFEVWNEPDLRGFFDGTQAEYFELYNHTVKAVKSVSPAYRVGGPATSATKWIKEFLHYCDSAKLPVDFVSTHDYGTTSVLDEFGTRKHRLKNNPDTIASSMQRVRRVIDSTVFKKAELHLTEWSTSPSSRDPMHDSYQNATYILNTLKKTKTSANSMSYWVFTDIFEEAGPGLTPFHGGFGLLNLQSIRKPTYYAFKFMNELGNTELSNNDAGSYICTSADKNVQALVWNYTFTETGALLNQGYFAQERPSVPKETTDLQINNVQNGKYKVEVYKVGYKENDPFTKYMEMGKPVQITKQQEKEIAAQSTGLPVSKENIVITNGSYKKTFVLRENDIVFIKLIRQK
jgi:xylan 1,4-beta-xylosidase